MYFAVYLEFRFNGMKSMKNERKTKQNKKRMHIQSCRTKHHTLATEENISYMHKQSELVFICSKSLDQTYIIFCGTRTFQYRVLVLQFQITSEMNLQWINMDVLSTIRLFSIYI